MALEDIFVSLQNIGVADVFLPFILIFAVIFALLQKINIFSEKVTVSGREETRGNRKINSVIAFAIALGAIIPHELGTYPAGADVITIINSALPNVALLVVAIIAIVISVGFFGINWDTEKEGLTFGKVISYILAIIAVIIVIGIFLNSIGAWNFSGYLYFMTDPNFQATALIVIVFIGIVWIIVGGGDKAGTPPPTNAGNPGQPPH